MSSLINKVKDAVSSDKSQDNTNTNVYDSNAQHHTHAADASAPRTDAGFTSATGAPHDGTYTANTGYTTSTGPATTTAGPHSSNIANKADPRVDSDLDGRNALGQTGTTQHTQGTAQHHSHASHHHQHHHTHGQGQQLPTHTAAAGTAAMGSAFVSSAPQAGIYNDPMTVSGNTNTTAATHSSATGPASSTAGPHSSNLLNKADPRVDSDLSKTQTQTGAHSHTASGYPATTSATTGPASNTAGPHSSNLANKADPRVDSDLSNVNRSDNLGSSNVSRTDNYGTTGANTAGQAGVYSATTGPASSTAGPHSSNLANKADPRVDSDLSNVNRNTNTNTLVDNTNTSTHGMATRSSATGPASNTAGPHSSDVANKLDPRVDSDLSKTQGLNTTSTTANTGYGSNTATNVGQAGAYSATTGPASSTAGPHSSNIANKADPRVDSDRDGRNAFGNTGNTTTTGTTGVHHADHHNTTHSHHAHGTHGHHSTTTGTAGTTGTTGIAGTTDPKSLATGPAPNTAGPHKSDLLNKLDPRVDSNLDGSKTYGGDKTFDH